MSDAPTRPNAEPSSIRLLVMDCDGVLTTGAITYDDQGHELKQFNVRDGLGLRVWQDLGFVAAIITGRGGAALSRRASELGIQHVIEGCKDKRSAILDLCDQLGIPPAQSAAMGDDWPDLAMFDAVGYAFAPADAHADVRSRASHVTAAKGGHGAVREAVEHLLSAKGLLDQAQDACQSGASLRS